VKEVKIVSTGLVWVAKICSEWVDCEFGMEVDLKIAITATTMVLIIIVEVFARVIAI
jgi:hypothetical protein